LQGRIIIYKHEAPTEPKLRQCIIYKHDAPTEPLLITISPLAFV